MFSSKALRRVPPALLAITVLTGFQAVNAGDPDPAVMSFKLPNQIHWVKSPSGTGPETAILYGEPSKPGFYQVLTKWNPHTMSRPHFHPNDRFIYVVSGTWWVGWGTKYNPDSTVPMPAGSFVRHYGKQVHYDGSKEGEVILLMAGEGPETATPAEVK